jgi:SAM-dependent methyltransferase
MVRASQFAAGSFSERGAAAIDAGDLEAAKRCFLAATRAESRNARHRFHLAVVLKGLGEIDAAAAQLTEALRLDPTMVDAPRRLAAWTSRYGVSAAAPLNAIGLRAALSHATADCEINAELAIRHLASREPLKSALALGRDAGWLAAAQRLCLKKAIVQDALLLQVLETSAIGHPGVEHLLTAVRRIVLLDASRTRFVDRDLTRFLVALLKQCWANEYVWAVSAEEKDALSRLSIDNPRLVAGDLEEGFKLLLCALYSPLPDVLGASLGADDLRCLKPAVLRDAILGRLEEERDVRARAKCIPSLGGPVDETSLKVARQYEANPYPRWTSLGLAHENGMRRVLARYFAADTLAFMDRPYEMLVAGCGTGQDAIRAGLAYGPNARVLGLDLSSASLAYASRMAAHFRVGNVAFMQGDIQSLDAAEAFHSRFLVIECAGVLHHMADPFQGWRSLLKCLAPGGLMLLGLYSGVSRGPLKALRAGSAYPGPDCDDDALRAYRQTLLEQSDPASGGELQLSRDFFTTSNFRDLVLHVNEHSVTIPEIAEFLSTQGLLFKGFHLAPEMFDLFEERFPGVAWPGDLAQWAEFEQEHPRLFNGMYTFWCRRP